MRKFDEDEEGGKTGFEIFCGEEVKGVMEGLNGKGRGCRRERCKWR